MEDKATTPRRHIANHVTPLYYANRVLVARNGSYKFQLWSEVEGVGHQVYLGLGSNSADAAAKLSLAREQIARLPGIALGQVSSVYHTEPQGYADQPWFSNMVVALAAEPSWSPATLLEQLLVIEAGLGRVRDSNNRFGPRAIDIDLLLFGEMTSDDPFCLLPHPRMTQRAFVLVPLREIAPSLRINGVPVDALLKNINYRLEKGLIYQ